MTPAAGPTTAPVLPLARDPHAVTLTKEEVLRYSRHLIMPEVGMDGQRRLRAAAVLCVGAGGLGSSLALYLAAAGVGRLGLVDFDAVELSNLQRQVLHATADVGRPKLESARERILSLNPGVDVVLHEVRLTSENALSILADYDVVADGTDNFPTRYLVNDACVLLGKPNAYGSIFRFEGQASVFGAPGGPCYRCLYPDPPPPGLVPSCAEGGVLGVLPGIVGLVQATETIKLILGRGEPLVGRLLLFDALAMRFRELALRRDPACPICGPNPTITGLIDYEAFCGVGPATAGAAHSDFGLSPTEVKARLDRGDDFDLIDVREPPEWEICHIEGSRLVPLSQFAERAGELARSRDIVVVCKVGARSAQAADFLRRTGFTRVMNLTGGILAWAEEVDPGMPRY